MGGQKADAQVTAHREAKSGSRFALLFLVEQCESFGQDSDPTMAHLILLGILRRHANACGDDFGSNLFCS
jgi:hypothetical protein